jgi:hypothetical protein
VDAKLQAAITCVGREPANDSTSTAWAPGAEHVLLVSDGVTSSVRSQLKYCVHFPDAHS